MAVYPSTRPEAGPAEEKKKQNTQLSNLCNPIKAGRREGRNAFYCSIEENVHLVDTL